MKTLSLSFACMGERIINLLSMLSQIPQIDNVSLSIYWQKPITIKELNIPDHIKIFPIKSKGLSVSRNEAITNEDTDFIWFLDDDVILTKKNIFSALSLIQKDYIEFHRVKIGCIENDNLNYKKYRTLSVVRRVNLIQVSSIEIIADLNFIKNARIKFNENIGLGTKYMGSEETHFLIDAWDKGAKFDFQDITLVLHSCEDDNRTLANYNIFEIRGATASRFGLVGGLLLLRWIFRYAFKYKKIKYIRALLKGFFRGYDYYK